MFVAHTETLPPPVPLSLFKRWRRDSIRNCVECTFHPELGESGQQVPLSGPLIHMRAHKGQFLCPLVEGLRATLVLCLYGGSAIELHGSIRFYGALSQARYQTFIFQFQAIDRELLSLVEFADENGQYASNILQLKIHLLGEAKPYDVQNTHPLRRPSDPPPGSSTIEGMQMFTDGSDIRRRKSPRKKKRT
jgi:hypothetical protein